MTAPAPLETLIERYRRLESALFYDVLDTMGLPNQQLSLDIQPLHYEPYFLETMKGLVLEQTESAARETLFLPIFPGLTEEEQNTVVRALVESLKP